MTTFNIQDSKIEQLNEQGNNVKVAGASGNVVVSQNGDVTQTAGEGNTVQVEQKPGFFAALLKKLKAFWKWIFG